jgi:hypothetical protein
MYLSTDDVSFIVVLSEPRYCELTNEDPLAFLQHCTKEDIMTFFNWTLDQYRVRKKSSLH